MPLKRDNGEERAARLDLLMEEYRVKHESLAADLRAKSRMETATARARFNLNRAHPLSLRRKRRSCLS